MKQDWPEICPLTSKPRGFLQEASDQRFSRGLFEVPYCGFVVIERPFYADDVAKSLLDQSASWSVYNGHLELVERQEPWSKVQEKKAEQLETLAKDLKRSHDCGVSPRRRDRRATTLILEDELMLRKAKKLLASQQEVGVRLEELLPNLPGMAGRSLALDRFIKYKIYIYT